MRDTLPPPPLLNPGQITPVLGGCTNRGKTSTPSTQVGEELPSAQENNKVVYLDKFTCCMYLTTPPNIGMP